MKLLFLLSYFVLIVNLQYSSCLMTTQKLKIALSEEHLSFISFIETLDDDKFTLSKEEKWSAGQQLEHIHLSIKPLLQVFSTPKIILKTVFGKGSGASRTYDEVVESYHKVLEEGGKATAKYVPKTMPLKNRSYTVEGLKNVIEKLIDKLNNSNDQELDEILVPHPLLGKMTIREMLYFTLYHVRHHHQVATQNLNAWSH